MHKSKICHAGSMLRAACSALILAVTLVGCGTTDPTAPDASGFRDPATAPYRSMQTDAGYRLVPGGKVRWDPQWVAGTNIYDSTREVQMDVGAMWVDANWGAHTTEEIFPLWKVVLAANAKSKAADLDTVYQWTAMDTSRHDWTDSLLGFRVRVANGFRIPTTKEAKYLVWAGDTARWAWGNQDPKAWAYKNLWGDSVTTVRNKFGVVMHRQGASGRFLSVDGVFSSSVYLPLFWEWTYWDAATYLLEGRQMGAPMIFVRSDL